MPEQVIIPVTTTVDGLNATELHRKGIFGKGVKVAVLDTGVNANHPMLKGAVTKQANFTQFPGGREQDAQGHGTWCAAAIGGRSVSYRGVYGEYTLQGIAPECEIFDGKVLGDDGGGSMSDVIRGIEWAVKEGADIISMSLGSMTDAAGLDPVSRVVNKFSKENGVIFVVAAGNSFGNFMIGSPGGAVEAITVGSVAYSSPTYGTVATFSSKGPTTDGRIKPTIGAFGGNLGFPSEKILCATAGETAAEAGEPYAPLMGTSMATPLVAGGLALLIQGGMQKDRKYVESLLAQSARMPHPADVWTGWGIFDCGKAYNLLGTQLFPFQKAINFQNILTKPLSLAVEKVYSYVNKDQQANSIPRLPL